MFRTAIHKSACKVLSLNNIQIRTLLMVFSFKFDFIMPAYIMRLKCMMKITNVVPGAFFISEEKPYELLYLISPTS